MNRRKFLALVSGAVGAVAAGLGLRSSERKAVHSRPSARPDCTRLDAKPYTAGEHFLRYDLANARRRGVLAFSDGELVWIGHTGQVEPISFSRVDSPDDWDFGPTMGSNAEGFYV